MPYVDKGPWQTGKATFYDDGDASRPLGIGYGGACGGLDELGSYADASYDGGDAYIDGMYAAVASQLFCGTDSNTVPCTGEHGSACGQCITRHRLEQPHIAL